MGYLSAGVRQLPYSDAIVAQRRRNGGGSHDIVSGVDPHPIQQAAIPRASTCFTAEHGIEHPCSESLGGIQTRECHIQLRASHELLEVLRVVLPPCPRHGEPRR